MAKFSIILPVRNGGEYVKICVNSILSQTLPDFHLHVLDNYSNDGTSEWLKSLNDKRIIVYPADRPLSIEENWARASRISKNEFTTLIGHDDVLNEDYLETIDALIADHPDASLYQTHFNYIDKAGLEIRKCKAMSEIETAEEFLKNFLINNIDVMGTGFMMRSRNYDSLGGIPLYPNLLFADFELWIKLTRLSYKATSPEQCFSFRLHQSTTTISPDVKFHQAFERFVYFLADMKTQGSGFRTIIREYGGAFLLFYCKGLSHRLLRTPSSARGELSVKVFIEKCKDYAEMLEVSNKFNPHRVLSIKLAKLLDSGSVGRAIFLAFKKLYPKPILK